MKKWIKRIVSIALVAVMTLGLATAAMADNAHFTFTDIDEPQPDLYVAKTVSSAVEGYTIPDATFTFVLKWDQNGDGDLESADNVIYYVYNEDGTQVWNDAASSYIFRTNSDGWFTLKAGQYARFEWAREVEYEVTELGIENFIQTSPAGAASGTVDENGTFIIFENVYIPPEDQGETTQLIIRKDISWPDGYETPDLSDVEFTFQVNIDGKPYSNEAYDIYDAGVTTKTGSDRTESDGTFTMTGDSAVVFEDIDVDLDYEVVEVENVDGWRATGNTSYAGATASPMVFCYFSNAPIAFSVEKERTDGAVGNDGGEFTFQLTDDSGTPMSGVTYYLYDVNGKLITTDSDGEDTEGTTGYKTGEDGTFTLEAGQKVLFIGLAEGTKYKIVEVNDEREDGRSFTVSPAEGVSGTVDASSSVEEYEFENEELTDITITKYGSRFNTSQNLLAGAEFTIYRLTEGDDPDDEDAWVPYPDAEHATKTTNDGSENEENLGKLTFENLPSGTYKIVETKTPAGYITAGEPIEITLPYSVENPTEGAIYSERDGVYYLYDLNYTVDNTATLVMPNTGGKAWIIIVIAVCGAAAALTSVYVYRRRHSGKEKVRA